jgi:hypothetical protein
MNINSQTAQKDLNIKKPLQTRTYPADVAAPALLLFQ